MVEPKPLYAQGFFHLRRNGFVDQTVVFDYYDPDHYYAKLLRDRDRLSREIRMLMNNMQYYLDQERVLINGEDTYPRVVHVEIGVRGRPDISYIVFLIVFKGELVKGINTYENIYEEEEVDYDYTVYWVFPESIRVIEADVGVPYRIYSDGRILFFKVPHGTRIGGYEKIVFEVLE